MFGKHKEWIVTVKGGFYKITAEDSEAARKIAFDKFGRMNCGFFYPANTTKEQQEEWLKKIGFELQTAESIIKKFNLVEIKQ